MAMDKMSALAGLVGGSGGDTTSTPEAGDAPDYDADMKTALGDLAAALGVTVKDPARGIEAIKTLHDLCNRAETGAGDEY